jgi:hypothetical protein
MTFHVIIPPSPPPPPTGTVVDFFGIRKLYADSATSPKVAYMSLPAPWTTCDNLTPSQYQGVANGIWRVGVQKEDIRLEMWSPNGSPWLNAEVTAYVYVEDVTDCDATAPSHKGYPALREC